MMIACLVIQVILSFFAFSIEGKTFLKCELARALSNERVPRVLLSNFVCLAEAVSGSNTSKISIGSPSSSEFGIFQIKTREFCGKNGKVGGKCNIKCEKLLDDAIIDDIQCAKKIQEEYGFKFWRRWNTRCKSPDPRDYNKFLPNLHNCLH